MSALLIGNFVDASIATVPDSHLLHRFGEYVARLGTQPVTVTISSLVEDILDSYYQITAGLSDFSWAHDLVGKIEQYVLCQDVWHHTPNRQSTLEAKFTLLNGSSENLDVEVEFTRTLPTVQFDNLRNTIVEGEMFVLRPVTPSHGLIASYEVESEYFLGPESGWMGWDEHTSSFRGAVPAKMAALIGAERVDVYTLPLELTTRTTQRFGDMRFERVYRCVLPLTVKRRITRCRERSYTSLSRSPDILKPPISLVRPLMRTPTRPAKENDSPSMEEVYKLLERKAEARRPVSPLRLNSLSLARLHDAVALAHPPSSVTDVEVRMVQCLRRSSTVSNKENCLDSTKELTATIEPRTLRAKHEPHCDSKMSIAVMDGANRKTPSPPSVCYKCAARGQSKHTKGQYGECIGCGSTTLSQDALKERKLSKRPSGFSYKNIESSKIGDATVQPGPSRPAKPERSQQDIDRWQASIRRNYKEFEKKATAECEWAVEADFQGDESGVGQDSEPEQHELDA